MAWSVALALRLLRRDCAGRSSSVTTSVAGNLSGSIRKSPVFRGSSGFNRKRLFFFALCQRIRARRCPRGGLAAHHAPRQPLSGDEFNRQWAYHKEYPGDNIYRMYFVIAL